MPTKVTMPKLGESVAEGTVGRWLKQEGDDIELDEPLVEIVTDKITQEMPSPVAGRLLKISVQPDQTVKVGAEIAQIEEAAAVQPAAPARTSEPAAAPVATAAASVSQPTAPFSAPTPRQAAVNGQRHRISPLARRMAAEHQLDLEAISGTGEGGRVRKDDIVAFLASREQAPAAITAAPSQPSFTAPAAPYTPGVDEEIVSVSPIRRAIAEHMVRSKHTSPHATTMVEVDVTNIARWIERTKDQFKRREGYSITFVPFVMKAAVEALKEVPTMNASWVNDQIILKRRIHMGVAVSTDAGLMVPVVHDADTRNLAGLARAVSDLAARARANKLTLQDMQGSTFTVNNPGVFGTIISVPIINQPHAGILSMDAAVKRPVVIEGDAIAIRSMMFISLSFDHRINDGLGAARFLSIVKQRLESYGADISVY
ncbi:MAG TPA: dihydrolipoamide acetyltransferase family protein [Ktedonobacterales bacterium]|nr:dihydrolipoamide acetyltransferase family protein [Ktedonobacterales bacterium]